MKNQLPSLTRLSSKSRRRNSNTIGRNITKCSLESLDEIEGCRNDFGEAFYALSSKIRELIFLSPILRTSIFSPSSSSARDSDCDMHVRLPKLNLSTFSGKYDEWFPFFDTFSVIHFNASLSNMQRF